MKLNLTQTIQFVAYMFQYHYHTERSNSLFQVLVPFMSLCGLKRISMERTDNENCSLYITRERNIDDLFIYF